MFVVGVLFAVVVGWCATSVALRRVVRRENMCEYADMRIYADMVNMRIRWSARCLWEGWNLRWWMSGAL